MPRATIYTDADARKVEAKANRAAYALGRQLGTLHDAQWLTVPGSRESVALALAMDHIAKALDILNKAGIVTL